MLDMSTNLYQLISEYPAMLRKALEEKAKCEREIEKLEEEEEEEEDSEDDRIETYKQRKEQIKLDTEIEKLSIRIQEAEGIAEMKHRTATLKPTESSAHATVRSDSLVVQYKIDLVGLKEKKKMLEIDTLHIKNQEQNRSATGENSLKEEKARMALEDAEIRLQEVEAIFEGYKLLAMLECKR